jgi:hypothetical protein
MPAPRVPALAVPVDARSAVTFLGYPNRSPLLAITTGRSLLVTLTLPERLEAGHAEFARQLACRSMAYAVEVERRYRGLAPLVGGAYPVARRTYRSRLMPSAWISPSWRVCWSIAWLAGKGAYCLVPVGGGIR